MSWLRTYDKALSEATMALLTDLFMFQSALMELEQLERLRSEDTPRRPMITHTIDQFILNPKSILLTSSYQIPSQKKEKAEKLAKNCNFRILL